jgi:signal transduction histidine kinase
VVRFAVRKWALGLGAVVAVAGVTLLIVWRHSNPGLQQPLPYLYENNRQLVYFVEEAARQVEKHGAQAFQEFSVRGSHWLNDRHYLFIYDINGVCVFHPAVPELVGRKLLDLKDMNGRPIGQWINEIGLRPEPDASGWIFYLWKAPSNLNPTWKISYIRKAVGPHGKVYLVGSGVHHFKIESIFVRQCVDQAVELLKSRGKDTAFAHFRDPGSRFFFFDTYIYVLNDKGQCLVDPAFPNLEKRDLTGFKDALGHHVIREMLHHLKDHDTAWMQYMVPKPGSTLPSRKLAYLRKVKVNGETLIVGADFFLATPIWMKP